MHETQPPFTTPPADTAPHVRAKKRPLWRRIARVAGIVLASLVALAVLGLVFLQTPWGKSFVRGRIEARLSAKVNGKVSLGSIDYSFLFGEIELGELEIRDASGKPALGVGSVAVALDRGSLVAGEPVIEDLAIRGLDVAIVQKADGTSNLTGLFKKSTGKPIEHVTVEKLAVSGKATITKPDGTRITIADLGLAGRIDARPAAKELDVALAGLTAKVAVAAPQKAVKHLDVAVGKVALGRRRDAVDVDVKGLAVGALGIESIGGHARLAGGVLHGAQSFAVAGVKVDNERLAETLGRELLLDDLAVDVSVSGPETALVLDGTVRTGGTTLDLDGTLDLGTPGHPKYQLALVGSGIRSDVIATKKRLPLVETGLRVDLTGSGSTPADLEADLAIAIGATKIGKVEVDGLTATATARKGAYRLERLAGSGLGIELAASGELAADKALVAHVTVKGDPAAAVARLAAAGVKVKLPKRAPLPRKLDLVIDARGNLEGEVAVELARTSLPLAGGTISLAGTAKLERKKLASAVADVRLAKLDLAALAKLAGRPPKARGSLSGKLALTKTAATRYADYDFAVALAGSPAVVTAKGRADEKALTAKVAATRRSDRAVLATVAAQVPLGKTGGKLGLAPSRPWQVEIDLAKRSLSEIAALLPERLRKRALPAGDVSLHVALAGTPAAPTGTIDVALTASAIKGVAQTQAVDLHGRLTSSGRGLALATNGTVRLGAGQSPIAVIAGTVALPAPFVDGKIDRARLRAGARVDATIDVPERELATLAWLRPKLGQVGGTIGGRIGVKGPLKVPVIDTQLGWRGYPTAGGGTGETTLAAHGTPAKLTATIAHGSGKVAITADIDRTNKHRVAIRAKAHAAETPLLPLVPAFVVGGGKLGGSDPGKLRWDMAGDFVLAGGKLAAGSLTGTLDLTGGVVAIPKTKRRYHGIQLAVAAEPEGLRIKTLAVHERDLENPDRKLEVSGIVAWEQLKPKRASLAVRARDWLLFGSPTLGPGDAPKAAADFDIAVDANLATPVMQVDATVKRLALRAPERFDRGHQWEAASVSGDVIYVKPGATKVGKLPVAARPVAPVAEAPPSPPRKRRPMDVRIHIPAPIRLNQTPFDVMAKGELTVTVRDTGVVTRGGLKMLSGTLYLFGRHHELVEGSLTFSDEHPKGWLALTFERHLPPAVMRGLARASAGAGARVTFAGSPTKPKTTLSGAANSALAEVMAMNNAGRPVYVNQPDMPASATVQAPRGDQLQVLTFMAQNLPHLLFLDRITAWADPYRGKAYGRIENVEGEGYAKNQKSRVKAVVRPPTPGRSEAELHYDRMLINNDSAALGVGVRAGSRVGGGVGFFVEWSSKD